MQSVDYIVYEGAMSRMERTTRRWWITCLVLIILLVGTNAGWLWYESQFEYFTVTQETDSGLNNYIGNDGDINNGTANDKR